MLRTESHNDKEAVEAEVIAAMRKYGYTLNAVNNYDENLLHITAANGCPRIVKEILDRKENCRVIDRKNKFGWTPLMQAIRNGNIESVRLLLEKKANVDEVTYLGMSVLGLAAAISKEMFETVRKAYPDALANAGSDDITPLCVAAMKNDKELFFHLMDLGMPLRITNEYTRIMMRLSTEREINALVEGNLSMDDYWNDTSDNIQVMSDQAIIDKTEDHQIFKTERNKKRDLNLNLLPVPIKLNKGLISPNLTYHTVPSPDIVCFTDLTEKANVFFQNKDSTEEETSESDSKKYLATDEYNLKLLPLTVKRSQQPAQSTDYGSKTLSYDDPNTTLGFTPEFSPLKSPHVPPDVNEESVFGDSTPTPPRCKTPPKGMLLNWQQTKMIMILRCFGLSQHIAIFLEQEVDIDLFLTLTDQDLIEIEYERDRRALLEVIEECKRRKVY